MPRDQLDWNTSYTMHYYWFQSFTEHSINNSIPLILNIPLRNHGLVGNVHILWTMEWECLILGGWKGPQMMEHQRITRACAAVPGGYPNDLGRHFPQYMIQRKTRALLQKYGKHYDSMIIYHWTYGHYSMYLPLSYHYTSLIIETRYSMYFLMAWFSKFLKLI